MARVDEEWLPILREFEDKGVRTFHMTDCLAQRGDFARLEKPFINYIITQLGQILGRHKLQPINSSVVVLDWDGVVTDRIFLERFPKPFDLCFDNMVRALWEWGRKYGGGEKIVPVFAFTNEYSDRMRAVERAYSREEWYRKILDPIAFDKPQKTIPLQAADLLVHQMNNEIEQRRFNVEEWAHHGLTNALYWATRDKYIGGCWFDARVLALTVQRYRETGEIYELR